MMLSTLSSGPLMRSYKRFSAPVASLYETVDIQVMIVCGFRLYTRLNTNIAATASGATTLASNNQVSTIINENGLTTADVEHIELIEKHMLGFFFEEGDYGQLPAGYQVGGGSKK